ncbi:hypothetical protein BDZ89DRAFT_1141872 [Hymenopellis radicata]|nr:hypothetical protein BDZ89DRAFT_1141872 [Hymenopellis radicata]
MAITSITGLSATIAKALPASRGHHQHYAGITEDHQDRSTAITSITRLSPAITGALPASQGHHQHHEGITRITLGLPRITRIAHYQHYEDITSITLGSPGITRIAVRPLQALRDCLRLSQEHYQHHKGITSITRASPALRWDYRGSPGSQYGHYKHYGIIPDHHKSITSITRASPALHYAGITEDHQDRSTAITSITGLSPTITRALPASQGHHQHHEGITRITLGLPRITRIAVWPLQALRDYPRPSQEHYQHHEGITRIALRWDHRGSPGSQYGHYKHYRIVCDYHKSITSITRASPASRGHHQHYTGITEDHQDRSTVITSIMGLSPIITRALPALRWDHQGSPESQYGYYKFIYPVLF